MLGSNLSADWSLQAAQTPTGRIASRSARLFHCDDATSPRFGTSSTRPTLLRMQSQSDKSQGGRGTASPKAPPTGLSINYPATAAINYRDHAQPWR
jgi:hypothetical protein